MIAAAHEVGAVVSLDGAQGIPHLRVDVQDLDCDFYAFSAHKLYGPTGVGVLWGKHEHLNGCPPYMGGGDMIKEVTIERTTYNELPHKFEAGTPNIEGGLGLGAAIDWVNRVGIERIEAQEALLLEAATKMLESIDGLRMIGTAEHKAAVCSFVIEGVHPSRPWNSSRPVGRCNTYRTPLRSTGHEAFWSTCNRTCVFRGV